MESLDHLRRQWDADVLADPTLGGEGCDRLLAWQMEHGACFDDRPLCRVLRPAFVTPTQLVRLEGICRRLMAAIRQVRIHITAGDDWLDRLGLMPAVRKLVAIDPGFEKIGITTRLDAFEDGSAFSFVELNAEAPAGIAYHDLLARMFRDMNPMERLRQHAEVRPLRVVGWLLQALLTTYNEWGRGAGKPRIAIVDWRTSPTTPEFHLLAQAFGRAGYPTVVADPRDLELRHGRLWAGDFRIDLVYRRVLVVDCAARPEDVATLVEAARQRAVCMVNPFRTAILHRKRLFAELTDPTSPVDLRPEERATIDQCIPWTRLVRDIRTTGPAAEGAPTIDLLDYIRQGREHLVLKPDDAYGGRGVFLGWQMDAQAWEAALDEAQAAHYVVQDRVPLPTREFPVMGQDRQSDMFLMDRDPYVFRGRMGGFLTRLAVGPLANVTRGGGMVPTFVVGSGT
ncbi:MAG: hypothetical protein CL928_02425 [Deltaproteobacteria bacterium]|nr:hypothetical protein [Deltaproteobacteria bacterium]